MFRVFFVSLLFLFSLSASSQAADSPNVAIDVATETAAFGTDSAGIPQTAVQVAVDTENAAAGGCSASADCWDGTTRSCSGGSGTTCIAVDSNCNSGQAGYARCGSTTYACPACPSSCSFEGASCTSSAFCASKCQLICDSPFGFCIAGKCTCDGL